MKPDENFTDYCRRLTDRQLEEVLRREYARYGRPDYQAALLAAALRNWRVEKGERIY